MPHKLFLLAASLCLLASCECKRYRCPGYAAGPELPEKTTYYRNAQTGARLSLETHARDISDSYGKDETELTFSCRQNDCMATAGITAGAGAAAGTPAIHLQLNLTSFYVGNTYSSSRLHYILNGMESTFNVQSGPQPYHVQEDHEWYPDTLRDVNTGLAVYPGVLIQTRKSGAGSDAAVKTYWSSNGRLIGFVLADNTVYWSE